MELFVVIGNILLLMGYTFCMFVYWPHIESKKHRTLLLVLLLFLALFLIFIVVWMFSGYSVIVAFQDSIFYSACVIASNSFLLLASFRSKRKMKVTK